ncbi:Golgi mannosyltransferase complex subunit [Lithohypha guttulata]|uniref:Golgi mannosyltransferase complex subunit n=1 Tax=Lithohypha guttulata TaxID=1690604 RepID=A0ABR0KL00_9EURO|nr:Golgi mannosyltransferase complex subunit [Lithohypha guttulata]
MSYFRQTRSSRPALALSAVTLIVLLYFFLGPSVDVSSTLDPLLRARKSAAAASNPLSPPTSAFRKSRSSPGDAQQPLAPPPIVHYQLNNLTASSNPIKNNEKVLVLTPLARFYDEYWANLCALAYPHEHISLGFITPKTPQGNEATKQLQEAVNAYQKGPLSQRFESVTFLRQDFEPAIVSQDEKERHKMANQASRRASMAKARNSLLFTTMGPTTSWVLWLDGDIIETPETLVQDLTSFDKSIIVPNCFQRYSTDDGKNAIRPYDYNSWRDSDTAHELASKMGNDEILLEGYAEMPTYRTLMAMLAETDDNSDKRRLMPLDGVGGTALLVKADVHRDGAMFPPFSFYHLIETEGFAKMARRLGYESWGLPNYFVYHYNE